MSPATLGETTEAAVEWLSVALWVAGGVVAGLLASYVITGTTRVVARRRPVAGLLVRRGRRPLQAILVVIGAWTGLVLATPVPRGIAEPAWRAFAQHALLIALIAAVTWFVAATVRVVEDAALARIARTGATTRARRVQTQAQVLRRVGVAVVVVVGIAAALLTFEGARTAGASLLASAGLLSVVAGLAAQTTLGNVFAGLQLAFTDAIRVDDIVIVEGQFGYIEEITLTYVVVRLWDDRRMIMPSTEFTTKPFENWTRQAPALLGTVEIETDWRVPVPAMRAELDRLLRQTDLWDERVGLLQVERATGGTLTMRALVSGKDAGTLTDLKYFVRENLVDWLQTVAPYALPRQRIEEQEVVTVTDKRSDPRYQEVVEELNELAELDGDQAAAADDTLLAPPLPEDTDARRERESAARRARRRAEREDRRRARSGESLRRADLRPRPSADATQLIEPGALGLPGGGPGPGNGHGEDDVAAGDRAARDLAARDHAADAPGPVPTRPATRTPLRGRRPQAEEESASTAVLQPTGTAVGHEASFFSGSREAEERAQAFSGPGPEVLEEREAVAERKREDGRGREAVHGKDAARDDGDGPA
ncbi:mechanosensitive ion channel family protein [Georgenia yuyongxinii]